MKTSLNNNLILKPYKKTKELQSVDAVTGFTMTKQKVGIECLELLVDANVKIDDNKLYLHKGSKVYFKEETLHTQKWPRQIYECDQFEEGFVIGNAKDILFVD